jgi:hypothetical protein
MAVPVWGGSLYGVNGGFTLLLPRAMELEPDGVSTRRCGWGTTDL